MGIYLQSRPLHTIIINDCHSIDSFRLSFYLPFEKYCIVGLTSVQECFRSHIGRFSLYTDLQLLKQEGSRVVQ